MLMGSAGIVVVCVGLSRSLAGRLNEQASSLAVAFVGLMILLLSQPADDIRRPLVFWGSTLCLGWLVILLSWSFFEIANLDQPADTCLGTDDVDRALNQQQALKREQTIAHEAAGLLADRASFTST